MQAMKHQQSHHRNQRYLVLGLGLTGYSVAKYLLTCGYDCKVLDDREQPPYQAGLLERFPSVEIIKEPLSVTNLHSIDCLVVSPGLSIRSSAIKKAGQSGKRIIGDVELFAEAVEKPVIAITGSNGKSTVTSLVGEMIAADGYKVAVGGNIGVPALDLLQQGADFYVLELSSFQLETTHSLKPIASTVLNISEDHMDRYENLRDYQHCKKTIYQYADYCISNQDDKSTRNNEDDILFSLKSDSARYSVIHQPQNMLAVKGEGWINSSELKLKGRHNWANCLAAMALAGSAGISRKAIVSALQEFAGLAHRSQWVAEIDGVIWINDSKATNPGACKAAIEGIDEPVILLAGGQSKGASMKPLCSGLKQHVKTVLLFGQDAEILQQSWLGCTHLQHVENLQQAVERAQEIAVAGDIVLLSPACASFDMYSGGFEQRGNHFISLVRELL